MHRNSGEQQRGRVQVAQIVQPGTGEWTGGGGNRLVIFADQLAHQPGYGVGAERFPPPAGEDQPAAVGPGQMSGQPFLFPLAMVFPQYGNGFAVEADDPDRPPFVVPSTRRPRTTAVDPRR